MAASGVGGTSFLDAGPAIVPGAVVEVAPVRLLDTGQGVGAKAGAVGAGAKVVLQVTGRGGVPATGVSAVVLNVTALAATKAGSVTVYQDGTTRPSTPNLSFVVATTIRNLVTVQVSAVGKIVLYNGSSGTVQLAADVQGYIVSGPATAAGAVVEVAPVRLLDTGQGVGAKAGAVGAGAKVVLQVTGRGGVPATGVSAVVLNVTALAATKAGSVTVYQDGTTRPSTPNLSFVVATTIRNLVTVQVSAVGKIVLYNGSSGTVQLAADVQGYIVSGPATAAGAVVEVAPVRLLDTGQGVGAKAGAVGAGAKVVLQVTGRGGVPATGVSAVVLNVTALAATKAGSVTVYQDGTTRPSTPNLSFVVATTIRNLVTVQVSAVGKIVLYNGSSGTVQLAADVQGYIVSGPATPAAPPHSFIDGPTGSGCFGTGVAVLPSGNIVVTDPCWNGFVGAVYLYDGATLQVTSRLVGSAVNDRIGSGGVTVLANGDYVINSPTWTRGAANNVGAVTWGHHITGVDGVVSADNSIVGGADSDGDGMSVVALTNGNYVVAAGEWNAPSIVDAGAVRLAAGDGSTRGPFTPANSLTGAQAGDHVGWSQDGGGRGAVALSNGNYLALSEFWDNGTVADAGAVTWGDGTNGTTGLVTPDNSLVGSTAGDHIGFSTLQQRSVIALTNGNYVVTSPSWDNGNNPDMGAATWGDGVGGTHGPVSAQNSLVGTTEFPSVGSGGERGAAGVVALTNGNYVVVSPGAVSGGGIGQHDGGAVTWGDGTHATTGEIGPANSLVGETGTQVGLFGVTALTNGNYVVNSPLWSSTDDHGQRYAGAVTLGDGTTGIAGAVSRTNSLVSQKGRTGIGGVFALTNGNYVVQSSEWFDGTPHHTGAATWRSGTATSPDIVSATNSIIGTAEGGAAGRTPASIVVLANGNYVVADPYWSGSGIGRAGAARWAAGNAKSNGTLDVTGSIVGNKENQQVGFVVAPLASGAYVVASDYEPGAYDQLVALTWGAGDRPTGIVVDATNSLLSTPTDFVGAPITGLPNGNFVVVASHRSDPGQVGYTVLELNGAGPLTGHPDVATDELGTDQPTQNEYLDPTHQRLLLSQPTSNRIVVLADAPTPPR